MESILYGIFLLFSDFSFYNFNSFKMCFCFKMRKKEDNFMVKHLTYRTKWISIHKYKNGTVNCQLFENGKLVQLVSSTERLYIEN